MGRELLDALAKAANGHGRDEVVETAANLILNAIRQSHDWLPAAEEELDDLYKRMKSALRRDHYTKDGVRNGLLILDPGLVRWLRSEGL